DNYDKKDNQHSYNAGAAAAITVLGHNNPSTGNYAFDLRVKRGALGEVITQKFLTHVRGEVKRQKEKAGDNEGCCCHLLECPRLWALVVPAFTRYRAGPAFWAGCGPAQAARLPD